MNPSHDMALGELALDVTQAKALAKARSFALATPVLRIATFHSGSLSALIAALPALLALRESFPGAHITCFARAPHVPLLAHFRACDEACARPGGGVAGQAALMARLHAGNYDLGVSFSPGANAMLLLWATGAEQRAGFVPSPFEAFLTHRVSLRSALSIQSALELVREVGAHSRGDRVRDALDVPQERYDALREALPFELESFVLVPFDVKSPKEFEREGRDDWPAAVGALRQHWPVVLVAPRAGRWRDLAALPARHEAILWPSPDALTLLALIRASRAVVGPRGAASELALLDEHPTIRTFAQDAEREALGALGL